MNPGAPSQVLYDVRASFCFSELPRPFVFDACAVSGDAHAGTGIRHIAKSTLVLLLCLLVFG